MPDPTNIPPRAGELHDWNQYTRNDADQDGIRDDHEQVKARPSDIAYYKDLHSRSFWERVERTIKAQNKTGKAIYGLGSAAIGILTGVNIEPLTNLLLTQQSTTMDFLTDVNLWTFVFAILSGALGYLKTKSDKEKTEAEKARDQAITQAQLGLQLLSQAKEADSEKGTVISVAEKDRIINQAEAVFRSIVDYGEAVVIGKLSDGNWGIKASNTVFKPGSIATSKSPGND